MPLFTVTPRLHGPASKSIERPEQFVAHDSGQVLGMVHRLGWDAADVEQDGKYLFSVALNRDGVWSITQRSV